MTKKEALIKEIHELADAIHDPCALGAGMQIGMTSMGLIRNVDASEHSDGWDVQVEIRFTGPECMNYFYFKQNLIRNISAKTNVRKVEVDFDATFDWEPSMMSPDAREKMACRVDQFRQLVPLTAAIPS